MMINAKQEASSSINKNLDQLNSKNNAKIDFFNELIASNQKKNLTNAFSDNWQNIKANRPNKLNKNDVGYGIPTYEKTLNRGIAADRLIKNEIKELCDIIKTHGQVCLLNNKKVYGIKFKHLFSIYTKISNKLVGLLLRARKHNFLDFDGEILFQGRDDEILIKLTDEIL